MRDLQMTFVNMPEEFVTLLKANLSGQVSPSQVFDIIRPNKALYSLLESSFRDLDDGRGLEKTMLAQGWQNFRNRVASLYIFKTIFGHFPLKSDLALVEDLVKFEADFSAQGVQSNSRIFMLAFYLKLTQLQLQKKENNKFLEVQIPREEILSILKLTAGRSERTDWLILIVFHLNLGLGAKVLVDAIISGKSFDEIYSQMSPSARAFMHGNLLSYSASIFEPENFLYEKI